MKEPKHSAESYRVICIILVVIIAVMAWRWYVSEEHRLQLLDELNESKDKIEHLESELLEARNDY